ncbi:MAG: hypothetical protein ACOC04_06520 [Halothece sp.]
MISLSSSPKENRSIPPFSVTDLTEGSVIYRGWTINTKMIHGKLWLQWQHPKDQYTKHGCPISGGDITAKLSHAQFMIDLAIKLESESPQYS